MELQNKYESGVIQMDEQNLDDPLPADALRIGIVYNLKSGRHSDIPDEEAEYDSIDTVYAIQAALEQKGHNVVLLEANEELPSRLQERSIDIAFNIAEGRGGRGREAQIPALLNFYGIPFTGSDETTLCIALDKGLTKKLLMSDGIRTPNYVVVTKDTIEDAKSLHCPVIVKPNAEGSSKGISDVSIATTQSDLIKMLQHNLTIYGGSMIAEEYIEGREFTVGVIGNGEDIHVFPPMEIQYRKATQDQYHVYSYQVKQNYKEYINYTCPANLSANEEAEMKQTTEKIFRLLSCRDFARADFRMTPEGEVHFIEINPLPGLAPNYSDYPMLAEFSGTAYVDLVNGILDAAVKRLGLKAR